MTEETKGAECLTPREMQIAQAYSSGVSYKDIAAQLFIAPTTVKTHLRTIYRKMGVNSKLGLYRALDHFHSRNVVPQSSSETNPTTLPRGIPPTSAVSIDIPDKPVIAVLPFVNLSSDPSQEFFADGLTEDIITRIGYLRGAVVISRTSSFVFKGAAKRTEEIGEELGARYLLEGSVRVAGKRIRIVTKLIDSTQDAPIWTNRFDREMEDIFALQDEITHHIVEALQIVLTDGEMVRDPGGTRDFEAWEMFHQGALAHLKYSAEDSLVARAYERDPDFIDARVFHAWTYWQDARSGFATNPAEYLGICRGTLDKLLETGAATAGIKYLEAGTLLLERQYDSALRIADEAVALGSSRLFGYTPAALAKLYCGQYQEAESLLREGIRTIPYTPTDAIYNLSIVSGILGDNNTSLTLAKEYMHRVPKDLYAYTALAIAYARNNLAAEATATIASFTHRYPKFRLSDYAAHEPFYEDDVLRSTLDLLSKAGLPE